MWQYKQEERELKRVEGDIIKNQRAVRHTVRDFGNGGQSFILKFITKVIMTCSKLSAISGSLLHFKFFAVKCYIVMLFLLPYYIIFIKRHES